MNEEVNKVASENGFVLSGQDIFGRYAKIAYGYKKYGRIPGEQDYHIYKCIQRFRSNYWCDVPLTYQTENNCYNHGEMQDVVNVIHCGISETKVIRVALKDIELLPPADVRENVHGRWKTDGCAANGHDDIYCSNCGEDATYFVDSSDGIHWSKITPNFCPQCGAIMDGGDKR